MTATSPDDGEADAAAAPDFNTVDGAPNCAKLTEANPRVNRLIIGILVLQYKLGSCQRFDDNPDVDLLNLAGNCEKGREMVHNIQGRKKKSHTYFGEKKGALALLVVEEKTIQSQARTRCRIVVSCGKERKRTHPLKEGQIYHTKNKPTCLTMALVLYTGGNNSVLDNVGTSSTTSTSGDSSATSRKYVGLSNQGATCYLNSLLQTLFMTPDFRRAMFKWKYDPAKDGEEEFCIPLQLQKLFGYLQLSSLKAVDTVALTRSFGWEGSEVFQQQDVQELMRVMFDALEESFKGTEMENIIDHLYAGELIDYLRCIDVDYHSERVDKFLDFALAIVPFGSDQALHSLSACIETYLRPEILDGDNKYFAESVGRKVDAIKGLKFGKLPLIMSVQLKRFVYDFTGYTVVQKKVNEMVTFPMLLDMNKYVARRKRAPSIGSPGNKAGAALSRNNSVTSQNSTSGNDLDDGEFETFLKAQMAELRKQQQQSTNNKPSGTDGGGDGVEMKESVSSDGKEDVNGVTTNTASGGTISGQEAIDEAERQVQSIHNPSYFPSWLSPTHFLLFRCPLHQHPPSHTLFPSLSPLFSLPFSLCLSCFSLCLSFHLINHSGSSPWNETNAGPPMQKSLNSSKNVVNGSMNYMQC